MMFIAHGEYIGVRGQVGARRLHSPAPGAWVPEVTCYLLLVIEAVSTPSIGCAVQVPYSPGFIAL